jgi:hypothetical protein
MIRLVMMEKLKERKREIEKGDREGRMKGMEGERSTQRERKWERKCRGRKMEKRADKEGGC